MKWFLLIAILAVAYIFCCVKLLVLISLKIRDKIRKKRSTNLSSDFPLTFVAIDTETSDRTGHICQIAYVAVENGHIVRKNNFLIRPLDNRFDESNIKIHHITPDDTKDAPDITAVWPEIDCEIQKCNGTLVAHNAPFDISCLTTSLRDSRWRGSIKAEKVIDTCALTGRASLYSCCIYFDIPLRSHHDALCDAEACARILLALRSDPYPVIPKIPEPRQKEPRRDIEIIHFGTPFNDKKIVVSGVFSKWPERAALIEFLKSCGATVSQSLSSRTNMFIFGSNPGPSKVQKAEELKSSGSGIEFISESELYKMIQEINNSTNENS